jgi:coproporphyrinogen III oxidase-like Fe-S oxidoreductase
VIPRFHNTSEVTAGFSFNSRRVIGDRFKAAAHLPQEQLSLGVQALLKALLKALPRTLLSPDPQYAARVLHLSRLLFRRLEF